jgi:hypothetical protein
MEEPLKPIGPCQKEKKEMILKWRRKEELFHFKYENVEPLPFNSGHSTKNKRGNSEKD